MLVSCGLSKNPLLCRRRLVSNFAERSKLQRSLVFAMVASKWSLLDLIAKNW